MNASASPLIHRTSAQFSNLVASVGIGPSAANVAAHIALALMGAGASVDFPGRTNREARFGQTLRGVHAVLRMAGRTAPAALPRASREGFNLPAAAKIAFGMLALLVLCSAEVRLHFGLERDRFKCDHALAFFLRAISLVSAAQVSGPLNRSRSKAGHNHHGGRHLVVLALVRSKECDGYPGRGGFYPCTPHNWRRAWNFDYRNVR